MDIIPYHICYNNIKHLESRKCIKNNIISLKKKLMKILIVFTPI